MKFPIPEKATYQKFVQSASWFALVGVFVAKFPGCVRVVVTSASSIGAHFWGAVEEAFSENFWALAIEGLSVSACDLISGLHGSPEYRAHLIKVTRERAVAAAS